jgi:hypothetical protein
VGRRATEIGEKGKMRGEGICPAGEEEKGKKRKEEVTGKGREGERDWGVRVSGILMRG